MIVYLTALFETCVSGACMKYQLASATVISGIGCVVGGSRVCSYHIRGSVCDTNSYLCTCPPGKFLWGNKCIVTPPSWPAGKLLSELSELFMFLPVS